MDILELVYETIKKYKMVEPGEKIVVGVSGGPDSVVLLDILYHLKTRLKISLHVAHLDHMFRGEESREDAYFVEKLVNLYNLPATIKNIDVPAFKHGSGLSSQVAARQVRYNFFDEVVRQESADKVALAHHADDQAETILMHFLRGTGTAGLRGMLPVRDNYFIRPLLYLRRRNIENYCRENKIVYRVDSSNLKTDYSRNKIRMHLLPVLEKEYNHGLVNVLTRLGELCREEEDYLESQAKEVYSRLKVYNENDEVRLLLEEFCKQPKVIQRRILRLTWYEVMGNYKDLSYEHVERTLKLLENHETGGIIELPQGVKVKKNYKYFVVTPNKHNSEGVEPYSYQVEVPGNTYIKAINKTLYSEVLLVENITNNFAQLPRNEALLDYDRLSLPLYVRSRHPGDVFKPLGLGGTMKLKKFFINQKVPQEERERIPLIVGGGKIFWVGGMRIAENAKINKNTQKVLCLKLI